MKQQVYFIDSSDADSGTSSNFVVKLPYPMKAKKIVFSNVTLQNSIYNVNSSNNNIQFVDTLGATRNASVTAGWYGSGATLATAVATAMNAAGGSGTYTCTYSSTTGKFTISETSGPTAFTLNFSSGSNQMYPLLGWLAKNYNLATSYTSVNVADWSGPNVIYLCSSALASGCWNPPMFRKKQSNVVLKIPLSATFDGINIQTNSLSELSLDFSGEISVSNLDFQLLYPDGTEVDLNSASWSFSFMTYR